jgi:hypothetical protein
MLLNLSSHIYWIICVNATPLSVCIYMLFRQKMDLVQCVGWPLNQLKDKCTAGNQMFGCLEFSVYHLNMNKPIYATHTHRHTERDTRFAIHIDLFSFLVFKNWHGMIGKVYEIVSRSEPHVGKNPLNVAVAIRWLIGFDCHDQKRLIWERENENCNEPWILFQFHIVAKIVSEDLFSSLSCITYSETKDWHPKFQVIVLRNLLNWWKCVGRNNLVTDLYPLSLFVFFLVSVKNEINLIILENDFYSFIQSIKRVLKWFVSSWKSDLSSHCLILFLSQQNNESKDCNTIDHNFRCVKPRAK